MHKKKKLCKWPWIAFIKKISIRRYPSVLTSDETNVKDDRGLRIYKRNVEDFQVVSRHCAKCLEIACHVWFNTLACIT
ncbi:hypothetical protein HZH66_005711 [Vespula vulgaris]|uniref:Uncharacterized protein n=1 Tax=Vespula vulgaris TaxID=7454 RepID=A0A834K6Y5_VESVU|nr:hypothetical protein HZH66_005711 [Vespula vulgaris]